MPIVPHVNRVEPSGDAVIWRFMDLYKFRDLAASEELCRVGGGALARWPPSAAQTARAVFPHA